MPPDRVSSRDCFLTDTPVSPPTEGVHVVMSVPFYRDWERRGTQSLERGLEGIVGRKGPTFL